jgi:hypothetical protein
MSPVRTSPHPTTKLWRRLAALLAVVAQIALGVAPLTEAGRGRDAGAHVEAAGTGYHHAHNEADCAACVAQHLQGRVERPDTLVAPARQRWAVTAAPLGRAAARHLSTAPSRAPPLTV